MHESFLARKDLDEAAEFRVKWVDIEERRWMKVSITPSKEGTKGTYTQLGFNPNKVALIGLKIGAAEYSTTPYDGPIYIDRVTYEMNR